MSRADVLTAAAVFGGPGGRRRRWVAVVTDCPGCGGLHTHRPGPRADEDGMEPLVRRCRVAGIDYVLMLAQTASGVAS